MVLRDCDLSEIDPQPPPSCTFKMKQDWARACLRSKPKNMGEQSIRSQSLTRPAGWSDRSSPIACLVQQGPKWSVAGHVTSSITGSRTTQPLGSLFQALRVTTHDQYRNSLGRWGVTSLQKCNRHTLHPARVGDSYNILNCSINWN